MKPLFNHFLSAFSIASWAVSATFQSTDQCPGYAASNVQQTKSSITADLSLAGAACNIYGQDLKNLKFHAEYQTESRVHVIIYDTDEQVYQIPESVVPRPQGTSPANDSLLQVSFVETPFSFSIERKATQETIFSTNGSNIIFESQYLGLRTSLPANPVLYGLGEHTDPLMLPTTNYVRTLWSRDAGAVPVGTNLYGNHPVYYEYRSQSNATHGVALMNSDGMDVKINTDSNGQYLEYNILGGVIDLYFMAGPDPFDVARQYSEVTQKAAMMPYWGFGFHQCRFGYANVDEVAEVVANYSEANIPLETMWTDIDYMDHYKVFTTDPTNFPLDKMRDLVNNLHEHNQHYVLMVDPAVAYQDYDAFNRGVDAGVFLKIDNGSIYKAVVWPGVAAYPDWFNNATQDYWNEEFHDFFSPSSGVDIDALWIDMNEPSNFCVWPCNNPEASAQALELTATSSNVKIMNPNWINSTSGVRKRETAPMTGLPGRNLIQPPYMIQNAAGSLSNKTANTTLVHSGGYVEYDTHNLYGSMMSKASRIAMLSRRPSKRPMIVTRSTFLGAGAYVAHWLGDNVSAWDQYQTSIRHLLQFVSFFQVPMVGADVCGFLDNTTETLCARWTTLGAFYPFYRNHNVAGAIPQEAYRWPLVAAAARNAIDIRYRLLDYIYTALYQQTKDGTPMLAPMWMHYPTDATTHPLSLQFFYGPSLLVSPVTDEDSTSVTIYVPKDEFYDFNTLQPVNASGSNITLTNVSYTDITVYVRGGSVIPLRISGANTTTALRKLDFELLVAPDNHGKASGSLYLDDGESLNQEAMSEIDFGYDGKTLSMNGTFGYDAGVNIQSVTILGKTGPKNYTLGMPLTQGFAVDVTTLQGLKDMA